MTATTGLASSTSEESQETTIPLRGSFAGDVGRRRGSGCADDEVSGLSQETTIPLRGSFAGDVGRRRGSGCADDEVSGLTEEEAARSGFGCRCPCSPEKPAPIGLPVCSAVSASQVANTISQSSTPPMWFFNFNRNGPSGFSGASTAEEVTAGVDARGLVAVITGASSGIGLETARVLALRGVRVVMAVRNVAAGHKASEAIRAEIPGAIVHVLEMDLSSMDSVRRFASEFDSLNLPLNILINNAGILSKDCIRSIDGLELHFATNHIGHFLLTNLLLENMKSTSRTTSVEGRIINVSSSGHILTYPEGICFDNVKDLSRFSTYMAYGQSKLANILHSTELARILKGDGVNISANAIHPGFVGTNLFKNWTMANVTGISGKYFSNCNLETPSSQASNAELAKKLWEFSSNIVSVISEKTRPRRLKKARHTSRRFPPFGSTTRTVSGLSFPAMAMATTKGARDGRESSRSWNLEVLGTVDGEAIGRTEEEARRCAGLRLQSLANTSTPLFPELDVRQLGTESAMCWFNRKGPSGFSGASTAEEVTAGIDARGLVAVITGASSGIGLETARVMALRGVRVVMAVRNVASGHRASEAIRAEIPGAGIHVLEMDLSSMDSVRRFATEFEALNLPLNILINNAGIMTRNCTRSIDGLELQFATNHIGHFLLTNLLLENMKRTSSETGVEGRIVNVSSSAHFVTYPKGICFDKVKEPSRFISLIAYGQSKLANILHSTELSRVLKNNRETVEYEQEDGVNISANAVHPGVVTTNLFRHRTIINALVKSIGRFIHKTVEQGAATTCYVALHSQVTGISGKYFSNCNLDTPSSQASNAELANKLWEFSSKIAHLTSLWPSGFSGASTAEEVTAGIDARGLVAVITGASSGIGLETARVLALRGVHVIMAVRNVAAGRNASEAIRAEIPGAIVHVLEMDLSSMDSVRRIFMAVESIMIVSTLTANILLCFQTSCDDSNNAGIKAWGCTRSVDGLELHFATNYIGHFLLTNLLMENMKSTSSERGVEGRIRRRSRRWRRSQTSGSGRGRAVAVAEVAKDAVALEDEVAVVDERPWSRTRRGEDADEAAALAEMADGTVTPFTRPRWDEFVREIFTDRFSGIFAYPQSKLASILHSTELARILKGAATTCYVALHPQVKGISGKYFSNCNLDSPSSHASNAELAKKLWEFSSKVVS
uniref:Uncharacterized protein n=1 Tax=Oryza glumipatula TaxID=40148 RepID=A0A0E0BDE5_9ORYZ